MLKQFNLGLFLFAFLWVNLAWSQTPPQKFYPINEVDKDSSLQLFVEKLKQAIAKKDKTFILASLDEEVESGQGGTNTIAYFKESWWSKQDEPSFWFYLEHIINLGGAFDYWNSEDENKGRVFVFPYVAKLELENPDDYFYIAVITGKNVNLRTRPDLKAPVITQLTYDLVRYVGNESDVVECAGQNAIGDPAWLKVKTLDNKYTGWVYWKYEHRAIDCRMYLKKKNGKWKIIAFVTGD